jgi:hypothetical protein
MTDQRKRRKIRHEKSSLEKDAQRMIRALHRLRIVGISRGEAKRLCVIQRDVRAPT